MNSNKQVVGEFGALHQAIFISESVSRLRLRSRSPVALQPVAPPSPLDLQLQLEKMRRRSYTASSPVIGENCGHA